MLLLAAAGWIAVIAGWRVCGSIFAHLLSPAADSHLAETIAEFGRWPWEQRLPLAGWSQVDLSTPSGLVWWWQESPLVEGHLRLAAPFVRLFHSGIASGEFLFLLACGLWELVIWSFFGGLITRLAAVELAGEQPPSWASLVGYARRRWSLYFAAPLFALGGAAAGALLPALAGLLLRSQIGSVVLAACWVLLLLVGLVTAEVLVGLFFGFPLMWATISSEGTDAFDALSRSFGYTYQRPISYLLYALVAAVLGTLGWVVVAIFTSLVVSLPAWRELVERHFGGSRGFGRRALEPLARQRWGRERARRPMDGPSRRTRAAAGSLLARSGGRGSVGLFIRLFLDRHHGHLFLAASAH